MLKIQSSLNTTEMYNLKNVLETKGIECEVRGEFRRSAMGEIPITDSFVELWLLDDAQEQIARKILAGTAAGVSDSWTCTKCGESIEAAFELCWNCQTDRP